MRLTALLQTRNVATVRSVEKCLAAHHRPMPKLKIPNSSSGYQVKNNLNSTCLNTVEVLAFVANVVPLSAVFLTQQSRELHLGQLTEILA